MVQTVNVEKLSTLAGHRDCIYTLAPSSKPHLFFSAGGDGIVAQWNLENPEIGDLIVKVPKSIYALETIPEKGQLLVGQNFEGIHLIDLNTKKELRSVKLTSAAIFDLKFYQNNIFVACGDGVVIVVDYETFAVRKHLKASDKSARCIALNPSSNEFAVGYSDDKIRLFDLNNLELTQQLSGHQNSVFTLQYTPDGKGLISGSRDAHFKAWQVQKNYQLFESIVGHLYAINHIAFRPDGKFFATCSMDKSIKIWHTQSLRLVKVIDRARHAGHGTSVNKLLWTDYDNQLVSASDDRMLSVWKVDA